MSSHEKGACQKNYIVTLLVSLVGINNIAQAKTEERRAACVLTDLDGRIRASGPCKVILINSNTDIEFDIEWDGSTRTQFSMSKFPADGTYRVKLNDGESASLTVKKKGTLFLFQDDRGFRGQVIFP